MEESNNILSSIQLGTFPKHIAVIMDGNGRWAKQQGQERIFGHIKGVESVRTITETCAKLGIQYLTLYSFSTENWNRPQEEVDHLMNLLAESLEKESETLQKNDIQLKIIGDIAKLPLLTQEKINQVVKTTQNNKRLTLLMALNYSSKWEIINAINQISQNVKNNTLPLPITEKIFEEYLATSSIPDPELLIRTGGEQRISNFLLYQLAYTELYFTETYWPDFKQEDLYKAIFSFQKRERRFGKTSEQIQN